jgi:GH15 family glucan-1,4-alpha-glucosidase
LREHRAKLIAMIERPLRPEFRDATGMVHNRREFWERTFDDAYELAYQTYVILGLRDAASLAEPLGAQDRADRWRAEADRIQ